MVNRNIVYKSGEILNFYKINRQSWNEFYPSEQWVFRKLAGQDRTLGDILDVGCACGGLAKALSEKLSLKSYTGVDIHSSAAYWASKHQKLPFPTSFIRGDIIEVGLDRQFDLVVSLSCVDWNIETKKIAQACWQRVKIGGHFIISLRLTSCKGVDDIKKSYQNINFSKKDKNPEVANYVIFNFRDALKMIRGLNPLPELIGAYGYWGSPSSTAVTLYDQVVFAVFYIKKSSGGIAHKITTELNLPIELFV